MAYVQVESDERLEEGPEGLEFKSFLGTNTANASAAAGSGNASKENAAFWNVEYYQSYFDVDTVAVVHRCLGTMLPSSTAYISTHLSPSPDLYGPFWTLTTLALTLFLSSSLAQSISSYLSQPGEQYDYDFTLLSVAVSLVYIYGLVVPFGLWIVLRWLGVGEWSVVEALAVWGYGQFVWIPVSILCVIPVPVVRWALVGVAFGLSGYFLVMNIYPILASAESKATRLLVLLIVTLHAAIALTFKIMFFNYYVINAVGPSEPIPGGDAGGSGPPTDNSTTTAMMLW